MTKNDSITSESRLHCAGNTLVELMLAMIMLAVIAVFAGNAFFMPRRLVVNSALEQSAIHAGIAEIERLFDPKNEAAPGRFRTDGIVPKKIKTKPQVITPLDIEYDDIPGITGQQAKYVKISTTVEYRDGETITLTTCRSMEY